MTVKINNYPLRMPDQLRKDLEKAAKNSGRSLHAEIINRLEEFSSKAHLLEDLAGRSIQLHQANTEVKKLREDLKRAASSSDRLASAEYERMKRELKAELLNELSEVVVDLVGERIVVTNAEREE